jgi:RNA polymerase sigma factor for flagellar operon FliA
MLDARSSQPAAQLNPNVLPPDPDERNVRLLAHRPLVRRIASRMLSRLPANVAMDELVQAGMIGLNEALTRFEEGRGATFDTYASRRIEGSMLDSLRSSDELSRHVRSQQRQIRAAVQALEHRLGRAPRAKEVSNELGWTLEVFYRAMLDAGAAPTRLEDEALEPPSDDSSPNGHDAAHAAVDEHADPQRVLQRRQRHEALAQAFDALEPQERAVMDMIYGRELDLAEIGTALGVSASRISQIHQATVAKLRVRMRDW